MDIMKREEFIRTLTAALINALEEQDHLLSQLYELLHSKPADEITWFMIYALERHIDFNTVQSEPMIEEAAGVIMDDAKHRCPDVVDWILPLRELLSDDPTGECIPETAMVTMDEALYHVTRLYGQPTSTAAARRVLNFAEAVKEFRNKQDLKQGD